LLLAYALKDETPENPNSVRRFCLNAIRRLKGFVTMALKYRLTYVLVGAALVLATVWGVFRINAKVERDRQVKTTLNLYLIGMAMSAYAIEHGTYPVSAETDFAAFRTHMTPYLKTVPLQDGWGRPFRYLSSGLSFVAWSNGSDGEADFNSGGGWRPGHEGDIVMTEDLDGSFYLWSAPENWNEVPESGRRDPRLEIADALARRGELMNVLAAAARGDTTAEFTVGVWSLFGHRLPQNSVAASRWLHAASSHGHAGALAMLPLAREQMTAEQFEEGRRRAEDSSASRK